MTEKLSILGSTGSIGVQALDVAKKHNIKIISLSGNKNVNMMESQAREFLPSFVAMADEESARELKKRLKDTSIKVLSGNEGVSECASAKESDTVLNSIVGIAGLEPTLSAIHSKKKIALANKETLVAGGAVVKREAEKYGVDILPVDSEHSAIFQSIQGMNKKEELRSIILTASGGPFFGKSREELQEVTLFEALAHPNWSMGDKITVDSATMMNKGLELIEAVWLFDVSFDMVDILVHRQSVVHSMVEFVDNSVIAQLGVPDMRIPIQYALTYPERFPSPVKRLSLAQYGSLTFEKPDYETFRCIDICKKAIQMGGLYPAAVNAANEKANELFRMGKIKFLDIPELIEKTAFGGDLKSAETLSQILETDALMREKVLEQI